MSSEEVFWLVFVPFVKETQWGVLKKGNQYVSLSSSGEFSFTDDYSSAVVVAYEYKCMTFKTSEGKFFGLLDDNKFVLTNTC